MYSLQGEAVIALILVLYGVGESKALIKSLKDLNFQVAAVVQTGYGGQAAELSGAHRVFLVQPGSGEVAHLVGDLGITQIIDATHPFQNPLSAEAQQAAMNNGILYLRFGRLETSLPQDPLIQRVDSWQGAAERAAACMGTVFLTTGSYNLTVFTRSPQLLGRRIVVRVLPEPRIIQACQEQGICPRDIVAMQGPFSVKLNKAIFQAYRAGVIVTRDGGSSGGTYNKIKAALDLKVPVILIQRETMAENHCLGDLTQLLESVIKNNSENYKAGRV